MLSLEEDQAAMVKMLIMLLGCWVVLGTLSGCHYYVHSFHYSYSDHYKRPHYGRHHRYHHHRHHHDRHHHDRHHHDRYRHRRY